MKKMNLVRRINAAFWTVAGILLMIYIHDVWSFYGPYTMLSFFGSLIFHGGFAFLIGSLIDKAIVNHFNK